MLGGHVVKTGSRATADRPHATRHHHASRDERLGGHSRLRGRALRRNVGGRCGWPPRRHVRDGGGDRARDERGVRRAACESGRGMGECARAARWKRRRSSRTRSSPSCSRAHRLAIPVTVHAALGAEIIHQHPAASGAAIGDTSHRDFRRLAGSLPSISRRRRGAEPRQRGDHARGVSQGADDRAQSRRRAPDRLHHVSISTCSATTGRA